MTTIVIDKATQAKLGDLKLVAELCDEDGNVLAYVTPATDRTIYDKLKSPNSEAELARREKEGGGRPLSEILADLEKES